jgi:hypothetical protein
LSYGLRCCFWPHRHHSRLHDCRPCDLLTLCPLFVAPSGLNAPAVSALTFSSIMVSWQSPSQPNGIVTQYSVLLDGNQVFTTSLNSTLSAQLQGLKPNQFYSVSLVACTGVGCTESSSSSVLTPKTSMLTFVICTDIFLY